MHTFFNRSTICAFGAAALLLAIASVNSAHAAVKIWTESAGTMIMPDRPAGQSTDIKLLGVRNEYISAQIGMRSDAAEETAYSFAPSALKGPGGTIPLANVVLFRAAEIDVDHTEKGGNAETDPARIRPLGKFPDALIPLVLADGTNVANSIKPAADQSIAFWVDIHIPGDAKPGDYTGKIDLKKGAVLVSSVPVSVHVANAAIPADSTIPSTYTLRAHPHVQANMEAYVKEMMAHHIQPNSAHYLEGTKNGTNFTLMDKYNPDGKGWVTIYIPELHENTIEVLKKIVAHLKSRGLLDRTFIYLKDEPHKPDFAAIMKVVNAVTEGIPELKGHLLDTLNSEHNEVDSAITHVVRALKCYGNFDGRNYDGRVEWDKRRADGQQIWFYESNAQGIPYPTFDINTPNLGFEPRTLGWAWWYEKAYGHLYWDIMSDPSWQLNAKFPPGDGQLIYPGDLSMAGVPNWVLVKDIHGPVVSRRLKEFRAGAQEWEMLKEAEKKVGREKVKALVDTVYKSMGQVTYGKGAYNPAEPMWSYSEDSWNKARADLIQILEH